MGQPFQTERTMQTSQHPRWVGLLASVAFHILVLSTLPYWSSTFLELDEILGESIQEAIQRNEKNRRIVWYKLPAIPSIRNSAENSEREHARGEMRRNIELVVTRNSPQSKQQLIEQSSDPASKPIEMALQNVIAREGSATEKVQPRKAVIPESARPLSQSSPLEAPPELQTGSSFSANLELARLPKPAPKKFIAPTPANQIASKSETLIEEAPSIAAGAPNTSASPAMLAMSRLPKMPPRQFPTAATLGAGGANRAAAGKTADFSDAPSITATGTVGGEAPGGSGSIPKLARRKLDTANLMGGGGRSGTKAGSSTGLEAPPSLSTGVESSKGTASSTVINLNPGSALPPPGVNVRGSFSRGSEVGPAAHVGNRDPNAAAIPNVSSKPTRGGPSGDLRLMAPDQILGEEAADGYFEIKLELARQYPKLSIPLPPSGRMLPRRIEPFFRGRSVFAIVIPIERMDRYGGDWIVWFSPKTEGTAGAAVLQGNVKVETPLPIWKLESRRWLVNKGETGQEQRVQIAAEISREGRVQVRRLLGEYGSIASQIISNDLGRWVFQPAKIEGVAVDVDAVLEIPYRFPPTVSLTQQ